jgi:hypothetical protein
MAEKIFRSNNPGRNRSASSGPRGSNADRSAEIADEIELVEVVTDEWVTRAEAKQRKLKLKRRAAPKPQAQLPPKPTSPSFPPPTILDRIEHFAVLAITIFIGYWLNAVVQPIVHAAFAPLWHAIGIR